MARLGRLAAYGIGPADRYAAVHKPEQATGDEQAVGPWSDVFSLGVILVELLTLRPTGPEESSLRSAGARRTARADCVSIWRSSAPMFLLRCGGCCCGRCRPPAQLRRRHGAARGPDKEAVPALCPQRQHDREHFGPVARPAAAPGVPAGRPHCPHGTLYAVECAGARVCSKIALVPSPLIELGGGRSHGSTRHEADRPITGVYCCWERKAVIAGKRDLSARIAAALVTVSPFAIEEVEVTNRQYAAWLNSQGKPLPSTSIRRQ